MGEMLQLILVLFAAMGLNIVLGMYYKIGVERFKFDYKKLLAGLIKALIIAVSFIGFTWIFGQVELSTILNIDPMIIINGAIILYTGKGIIKLAKILGVKVKTNKIN